MRWSSTGTGLFVSIANPFVSLDQTSALCKSGVNHVGDDLPGSPFAIPISQCRAKCAAMDSCDGYVYLDDCEGHTQGACFLKSNASVTSVEACSCLSQKPFAPVPSSTGPQVRVMYAAGIDQNSSYPTKSYVSEPAVLGITNLSAYKVPSTDVYTSERTAFIHCVETFLLDKKSRLGKSVKVNVVCEIQGIY